MKQTEMDIYSKTGEVIKTVKLKDAGEKRELRELEEAIHLAIGDRGRAGNASLYFGRYYNGSFGHMEEALAQARASERKRCVKALEQMKSTTFDGIGVPMIYLYKPRAIDVINELK